METRISRHGHTIKANRPHRSWHLTLRSVIARSPDASNNAFVQCAISSSLRMPLVNSDDVVSEKLITLVLEYVASSPTKCYTSCES